MKLIENYCNAVVRFLNNKDEIKKEVQEMIYSMLEDRVGFQEKYQEEDIVEVLKEIGNPNILALKYADLPKQIVSEKNIYQFYYLFAIIMIFVVVGNIFMVVFDVIGNVSIFYLSFFGLFFRIVFLGAAAFGILAIVFMWLEHYNKEINIARNFNPLDLKDAKIDDKKFKYSVVETIVAIFFIVLALVVVNFFPDKIAVYSQNLMVTIFNVDYIQSIIWYINIILFISLGGCVYLLFDREKTIRKLFIYYIYGIISSIIFTVLLTSQELFNPEFIDSLNKITFFSDLYSRYGNYPQTSVMIVIGLIVLGHTIEFVVNISRMLFMRKRAVK